MLLVFTAVTIGGYSCQPQQSIAGAISVRCGVAYRQLPWQLTVSAPHTPRSAPRSPQRCGRARRLLLGGRRPPVSAAPAPIPAAHPPRAPPPLRPPARLTRQSIQKTTTANSDCRGIELVLWRCFCAPVHFFLPMWIFLRTFALAIAWIELLT